MTRSAAGISAAELHDVCAAAIDDLDIAGAQAAVFVGDELVTAAVGVANVDLGTAVSDDTVFQIGSTTKVYTATLMMQLVDAGRVDLDVPVTTHLPGVQLAADGAWRSITPRHLMSMSSGLDNGPYLNTGRGDDAVRRYVDRIAGIPAHFAPGSSYGYSNASTIVSGLVIEHVTGMAWDDVLEECILQPAGLNESVSLFDRLPYHRVAVGRFPGEEHAYPEWAGGRGMGPSGGTLAASARDLARFGRIFLHRGRSAGGAPILSERAVAAMETPHVSVPSRIFAQDWCLGPYRKQWGEVSVWGHSGTTASGSTHLLWIPERGISIATTVNTPPRGYPFADAVFNAILRDRLGLPKPPRPEPGGFGPVDPAPYVGRYASYGMEYEVGREGDDLVVAMTMPSQEEGAESPEPIRSVLHPIAPHRFLPADEAITSFHLWDVAFTLSDEGTAALLHNGAFAAPRVGSRAREQSTTG